MALKDIKNFKTTSQYPEMQKQKKKKNPQKCWNKFIIQYHMIMMMMMVTMMKIMPHANSYKLY